MQQIERTYGKGSIMRYGDGKAAVNIESISTGSLALDLALGVGGLPRGRIIEIYGPESSGKTTLALHVLAQAQKQGGEVAFIDAEHALDGGADGLDFYRAICEKWRDALRSQGKLLFEVGIGQADAVLRLMRASGFGDVEIVKDLNEIPRVGFGTLWEQV